MLLIYKKGKNEARRQVQNKHYPKERSSNKIRGRVKNTKREPKGTKKEETRGRRR